MKIISAFSLALFVVANAHAANRPNIVLIFIDDAAYSDFNPFGKHPDATPNVEKLAAEGARYTRWPRPSIRKQPRCIPPPDGRARTR